MTSLHAGAVLSRSGWVRDVRLELEGPVIARMVAGRPPEPGDERHDVLLPGMANLHSHAFQRGMAGLAEARSDVADSFWSWREVMYRFALATTPEQMEAIAAHLFVEMLEAGFTHVAEFHYLHHAADGRPYADIAELAGRIVAASAIAGIGLTLLPVFYGHGGFGGRETGPGQRRFVTDLEAFARLVESAERHAARKPGTVVGVAPHSLRAVTPDELARVAAIRPGLPVHIHIAEQVKEVEDCLAWSGARPVSWLLDHAEVGRRWCLVHATHVTAEEVQRIASSGAVAGLCPITEANLGDGIFPARALLDAGGSLGIGSDSNIRIGVTDELTQLEYSQRLRDRARNVLAVGEASTGEAMFRSAMVGGRCALGLGERPAFIEAGANADFVSLDLDHPAFAAARLDQVLDCWIFSGARAIDAVWASGEKVVIGGRHVRGEAIRRRFRAAMAELATA